MSVAAAKLVADKAFSCVKCGGRVPFEFQGLNRVGVHYADCVNVFCPHCQSQLSVYGQLGEYALIEAYDDPIEGMERVIELRRLREAL